MSEKSKDILIGVLLTIIIGLIILIILITTDTITFGAKIENDQNNSTEIKKLTESEAITIGKELYDKMTEIKDTEVFFPYCGISRSNIRNQVMKKYNVSSFPNADYYESKYSNIEELKNDLRNYMSEAYVNEIVDTEPITDLSMLLKEENVFANYIIDNNKLYCRAYTQGLDTSLYLDDYDIFVSELQKNKIIYNIKSKYVISNEFTKCFDHPLDINNCTEDEIEYKDTTFVIEKNSNDKWIVTNFKLHD